MVALKLNFGSNKNSREPALKMGVVENSDHFFCKKANKEKQLILKKKKKTLRRKKAKGLSRSFQYKKTGKQTTDKVEFTQVP